MKWLPLQIHASRLKVTPLQGRSSTKGETSCWCAHFICRHELAAQGFQWATDTIQKKVNESPDVTENRSSLIKTLISACIFSTQFPYTSYYADGENLFIHQELLYSLIIRLSPTTPMIDGALLLWGEIRFWSWCQGLSLNGSYGTFSLDVNCYASGSFQP